MSVNLRYRDEAHVISMSHHFLIRVIICTEPTLVLFDSGSIPNGMSLKMVETLDFKTSSMCTNIF